MKFTLATIAAFAALSGVAAHGYVETVTIGSTTYTGYLPYSDPYTNPPPQRIIRKIPGNGPVEDVTLIDAQCNGWSAGGEVGSAPAPLFATVAAGSQVRLKWTTWPDTHIGPLITYMAKVPSGQSVTSWNPGTAAVWFKVHEAGFDQATKTWAAIKLIADGNVYTFTIPSQLSPGQYIIRHEIIALHSAYTYPGAQLYPSCIQVQVTGSGTVTPSGSNLVAFPGAYTPSTPGLSSAIWNPSNNPSAAYPIPGPPVYFGGSNPPASSSARPPSSSSRPPSSTVRSTSSTRPASSSARPTTSSGSTGGTAPAYGQCGGQGWTGPTACVSGYVCTVGNPYYSQCVPA